MFSYSTTVEHVTISFKSRLAAVTVSHALTDPLQALASVLLGAPPNRCACASCLWRVLFHACSLVVCVVVCSARMLLAWKRATVINAYIFTQLVQNKRMTKSLFYFNYRHVVARNCWCAFASSSLRVQQRFLADVGFDIR